MMLQVQAGHYTVRGVSVGGVYTSLQVPQLGALFDVGIAPRSFAGIDNIFLSHGHADHVGALVSLLGVRGMMRKGPPTLFAPAEIEEHLRDVLSTMSKIQRFDLEVKLVPMTPGDEHQLRNDLRVRAFRTHHPVPSLGYQFFSRVEKLKPEFKELPGAEIGKRRRAGEALFNVEERLELAYATDTLPRVLDTCPSLLKTRCLILECSFLDEKKAVADARAGCHIHLDELLPYADRLENEHLVLMHFSQIYSPAAVHQILKQRCPPALHERIVAFAPPPGQPWPG